MENNFKQWHTTEKVKENGVVYFLKHYEPNSYEIKNEVSWLTSSILKSVDSFKVPTIRESSIENGFVKMDHIDVVDSFKKEEVIDYLIKCAVELHTLIKSNKPFLRTKINDSEYIPYLKKFTETRINSTREKFEIPKEVSDWIISQIEELKVKYFSIVHRDLRCRHLLFSEVEKPTLIDWEFSNISEPAQDLAKLVYDGVVNHLIDFDVMLKKVVKNYSQERKISNEELEKKILTFLPIIPLEHSASFVIRKPDGYESEVLKDLAFITTLYEKNK